MKGRLHGGGIHWLNIIWNIEDPCSPPFRGLFVKGQMCPNCAALNTNDAL